MTVYDEMEDYLNNINPAYHFHNLIHILKINDLNPTTSSALYVTGISFLAHNKVSFIVLLFVALHVNESLFVSITSTMFVNNGSPSPTLVYRMSLELKCSSYSQLHSCSCIYFCVIIIVISMVAPCLLMCII